MLHSQITYDICIIGAGASGLSAAIAAKRRNPDAKVVLLEEKDRIGQKILVTGNGRCNLSNMSVDISHYGGEAARYSELIGTVGTDRTFFESISLITYADAEGRLYPYSNQASSVLNALKRTIDSLDIDVICSFKAVGLRKDNGTFTIESDKGDRLRARASVIAVGSPAGKYKYDIQPIVVSAGDKVTPFRPALVPVHVRQDVRQMKGARFKASVQLVEEGIVKAEEKGEVQVGDGYISGICVMNLSRYIVEGRRYELRFDLVPDLTDQELESYLSGISRTNIMISELLSGILPKRVGEELLKTCCDNIFKRISDTLSPEEFETIRKRIRNWTFSVRSLGPVNMAQISTGGVCGLEPQTLASPTTGGLFYCGEVVNVDGECGGYNLHWAWVSGQQAGVSASEYIKSV